MLCIHLLFFWYVRFFLRPCGKPASGSIIGIAIGGFFGNLNWKWLGAVIIGLVIIAVTAAFINYVAGEQVVDVEDTLK